MNSKKRVSVLIRFLNLRRSVTSGFTPLDNRHPTGFTLIELMIVMAIIAILAVLGIAAILGVRREAKYTQARADIRNLQIGMETYKTKYGRLPPYDSSGSSKDCFNATDPPRNDCGAASFDSVLGRNLLWETDVVDRMYDTGFIGEKKYKDPWGNYYSYDKQDGHCCGPDSYLCTAGADGRKGNNGSGSWGRGDDYCIRMPYPE